MAGYRLYGMVDSVPGMFNVRTEFVHGYYFPLIPVRSVIMLGTGSTSFHKTKIRLSVKSVLLAWLRIALIATGVVFAIDGGAKLAVGGMSLLLNGLTDLGAALILIALAVWTWRARGLGRASYARAVQLAELMSLKEEDLVRLELAFGRVSAEEAEKTLEQLRADAIAMEELG